MRASRLAQPLLLAGLSACSAGQILFHVDTDATVPSATPAQAGTSARWLVDRLAVEVLEARPPGWAAITRHDFPVDEEALRAGLVSFGVPALPGHSGLAVRLRLFRSDHATGGEPAPGAYLERTYRLPEPPACGLLDLHAVLLTQDVGRRLGADQPLIPDVGGAAPSLVGTWPGAAPVRCPGTARPEEACVPGGAFWFGDPVLRGAHGAADDGAERLVVVSPFYLDLTEVTVADFRESWPDLLVAGLQAPFAWNRTSDPSQERTWCNWTPTPVVNDRGALPLNCVTWATADAFCRLQGKHLPSEAQFEFLASGRGAEFAFPWGSDTADCRQAVFARGGIGQFTGYDGSCRPLDGIGGPLAPGSGTRDRVTLAEPGRSTTREVVDLGGNLSEYAADDWLAVPASLSLAPDGVLYDPVIVVADSDQHAVRGGAWVDTAADLRAARHDRQPDGSHSTQMGFRCARPAIP